MFPTQGNMPDFRTMPYQPPIVPTFSQGGHLNLRKIADIMRAQGEGEDKVLAHINIDEARELNKHHGFSGHNPITGLPQFGKKNFLRRVARVVAPLLNPKQAYKDLRKHGPTIGALIGTAIGGPVGGTIGGGLGGLISSRKSGNGRTRPFSNALRGLGHGAIIGGTGHVLGNAFSGATPGISGPVSGQGGMFGGLGNSISSSISGLMGGGGNAAPGASSGGGLLSGLMGGSGGGQSGGGIGSMLGKLGISPLEALLGAGMFYGMSKSKLKQAGVPENIMQQIPDFMRPEPQKPRKKMKFADGRYVPLPENWNPETDSEHKFYQPYEEETPGYAEGGYLEGPGDGQSDSIPARLAKNEFVMPADVVSAVGSGSSEAGAKAMYDFMKNVRAHRNKNGTRLPPKAKSLAGYGLKIARR